INLQRYRGYTNTASATYRNSLPDEVETHQSSVAVNAAHAYTMREEDGMSE
ncbi:hypothetical protein ALC60_02190, partial [Trachymyrmex zeteki]